jgi:hypothetical protein
LKHNLLAILGNDRGNLCPRERPPFVDEVRQDLQQRRALYIQWMRRRGPERLAQLPQVVAKAGNAFVLGLRQKLPNLLCSLPMEHLEEVDHGNPILAPGRTHL